MMEKWLNPSGTGIDKRTRTGRLYLHQAEAVMEGGYNDFVPSGILDSVTIGLIRNAAVEEIDPKILRELLGVRMFLLLRDRLTDLREQIQFLEPESSLLAQTESELELTNLLINQFY